MAQTSIREIVLSYADGARVAVSAKLKERGSGVKAHISIARGRCVVVNAATPLGKLISRVCAALCKGDAPTLAVRLKHTPGRKTGGCALGASTVARRSE